MHGWVLNNLQCTANVRNLLCHEGHAIYFSILGLVYIEHPENSNEPILLFSISQPILGSDPGAQLLRFAKELRGSTLHLDMISLGRGQGPKAEELIAKAQILKGRWLFLQNCHLAASWMPKLQTIVDRYDHFDVYLI